MTVLRVREVGELKVVLCRAEERKIWPEREKMGCVGGTALAWCG